MLVAFEGFKKADHPMTDQIFEGKNFFFRLLVGTPRQPKNTALKAATKLLTGHPVDASNIVLRAIGPGENHRCSACRRSGSVHRTHREDLEFRPSFRLRCVQ
jgi:hypothetical protein